MYTPINTVWVERSYSINRTATGQPALGHINHVSYYIKPIIIALGLMRGRELSYFFSFAVLQIISVARAIVIDRLYRTTLTATWRHLEPGTDNDIALND